MDTAMAALRWVIGIGVGVWLAMLVLDWIGPTEPAGLIPPAIDLPPVAALDDWLAAQEAAVPALRPDAAKAIVWAAEPGVRTEWAVVYLHGFSASREEIRPVPDRVAEALGANLFYTRLTGHGRDGPAMTEGSVEAWVADTAEALAVGRTLGARVLVIGTSTGGTLAALVAHDPDLVADVAGVVLVSPNFRLDGWAGRLVEWPAARSWGPLLFGETRGFEPLNAAQGRYWTTRYPTVALASLGALTHAVRGLDPGLALVPALFVVSDADRVVDSQAAVRQAARWGNATGMRADLMALSPEPGDRSGGHVMAGDVLNPGGTAPLVARILGWVANLQP